MNIYTRLIFICFITFCSCKVLRKPTTVEVLPEVVVQPQKIKTANGPYHPSRTLKNDLLHTKLEVNFDWTKQYLNGLATLTFKPYFYSQKILDLDAKGMDIHSVQLVSKENKDLKYYYEDKKTIKIYLDKTYTRNDTFVVQIKYTAKPNELPKGGSEAITEDKGLYFINPDGSDKNKPKQIWTQGETESSSCWFPTIDSPNERCTQEMYITVDSSYVVLSNGEFVYAKANTNGTKTHYWKQNLPHAPYLFMMAIGKFAIVNDKWREKEVDYYVEPAFEPYAKNIFGNTPEMIEFFSTRLGYDFPWQKYSQVVVRDYVSGAMENTTATIFMEALQVDDRQLLDENWDGIIAHELFHHWFGDLVTCESWSNLPLNESFANYAEYLWAEHKYGVDEADYLGEKEKEEYFDEARSKQEPLIRYHYLDKEDMFDRHSYNKGGRVLHMLRKYVGDDAFFESLKLYLTRNQFTSVEIHDLRLAFEDVTGEDLNWFFNQWFLKPGHPDLKISHHYGAGVLHINVMQLQDTIRTPIYKLPVDIDVWINGLKTTERITIEKQEQKFSIPLTTSPQLVLFDAQNQLLGKVDAANSEEELIFQYQHAESYLARRNALEQLFEPPVKQGGKIENPKFNNPVIREILASALQDNFWAVRNFALDQFVRYPIPELNYFIPKIESIGVSDSKPSVKAKAIYLLSSYDNMKYKYIYEKGINEKPYSVVGASLASYIKTGDPAIAEKIKEFEKLDNLSIIIPLADYYTETKDKTKYAWFRSKINLGDPRKLYNFLDFFGRYASSLAEGAEREDAKKLLEEIISTSKYDVIKQLAKVHLKDLK